MSTFTLDQIRAREALGCVEAVRKCPRAQRISYRSYVENLPTYIVMNGLGQAVATLLARANKKNSDEARAYKILHEHVQAWLCRRGEPAGPYHRHGELIRGIVDRDQDVYVRAHAEVLAFLIWLKKFAQAMLERRDAAGEGGEDGAGDGAAAGKSR